MLSLTLDKNYLLRSNSEVVLGTGIALDETLRPKNSAVRSGLEIMQSLGVEVNEDRPGRELAVVGLIEKDATTVATGRRFNAVSVLVDGKLVARTVKESSTFKEIVKLGNGSVLCNSGVV